MAHADTRLAEVAEPRIALEPSFPRRVARVQDRLASAAGSWPQLLEPYRSRIAIGCRERRLKTHSCVLVRYRQPAWVTLALFLSCVRINLPRTHCAELNGSTANFVNVTVGNDRDAHTAVPSISGSAGFYAGAGRHAKSCHKGLGLRAQGREKTMGIGVAKSGQPLKPGATDAAGQTAPAAALTGFLLLYVALYSAYGTELAYMPAFLLSHGLSVERIGVVLAAGIVVRIASGPAIGRLADRLRQRTP